MRVERRDASGPFLFVCDHASAVIPSPLADLGLGSTVTREHVAWDIGALAVARSLSDAFSSPLVYPAVSRLVIDCNRALDAADLIVADTEFGPVPGNAALTAADRQRRIDEVHAPFHAALADILEARLDRQLATAVVAIHSFTPTLGGSVRPWHVGLLFNADDRLAHRVEAALGAVPGIRVGRNVPYSGQTGEVYYTLDRHAEARGLPAVMIELRNDLLRDRAGRELWARRLGAALATATNIERGASPPQQAAKARQ